MKTVERHTRTARFGTWTAALAILALGSGASAQIPNDDCTDATVVDVGSVFGTTEGANSDGSASCGSSSNSPDVWYRFAAPSDGTLTAATCGSPFDTVVSIHEGSCPGDEGNQIVCNDDNCSLQSSVDAIVEAGVEYLVRVSGFNGSEGAFELSLEMEADPGSCLAVGGGDSCDTAVAIGNGCVLGSTLGATSDGTASCGSSDDSPDRWYTCTPTVDGTLAVSTCDESFFYDTVLSVHTGCPGGPVDELGCNDDDCAINLRQSSLEVPVEADTTYWIRVSGFSGDSGAYRLDVSCPGAGPFELTAEGVCPGRIDLTVSGATPNGRVAFAYDTGTGSFALPTGECAGTPTDLAGDDVTVIGALPTDATGAATTGGTVPDEVCNGVVQAIDLAACTASNPATLPLPGCDCYFSSDCQGGEFCDWGVGGPGTNNDSCNWREPKPPSPDQCTGVALVFGAICDGICSPTALGSICGDEDPAVLAEAVERWNAAFTVPALTGGGLVDEQLAEAAMAVPFDDPKCSGFLSRQVGSVLLLARGHDYFIQPPDGTHPPDPLGLGCMYEVPDLSQDGCRAHSGNLAVSALAAELVEPGSGRALLEQIPGHCSATEWPAVLDGGCAEADDPVGCLHGRVVDFVELFTTPLALD